MRGAAARGEQRNWDFTVPSNSFSQGSWFPGSTRAVLLGQHDRKAMGVKSYANILDGKLVTECHLVLRVMSYLMKRK